MKAVPCTSCLVCPHRLETPYPTSDSWERAYYWWCINPDVEEVKAQSEEDEKRRLQIKKMDAYKAIRKIAGYVEWHEEKKVKIPKFCPLPNMND